MSGIWLVTGISITFLPFMPATASNFGPGAVKARLDRVLVDQLLRGRELGPTISAGAGRRG